MADPRSICNMAEKGVDSHVEAKNVVVGAGAEKEFCRDRGFDCFGDGGYRSQKETTAFSLRRLHCMIQQFTAQSNVDRCAHAFDGIIVDPTTQAVVPTMRQAFRHRKQLTPSCMVSLCTDNPKVPSTAVDKIGHRWSRPLV